MILKAGDRVKFVNEKGEGRVSKIINSSRVLVAIEEGFEIPYLLSDLIKIEENDTMTMQIYIIQQMKEQKIQISERSYGN